MAKNKSKPKIVFFDFETLPDPRQVYRRLPSFGDWPGRGYKAELSTIMCFGHKIQGEKKAKCFNAWDFEGWETCRQNDYDLVKKTYDTLVDADQIVTHNGKSFDLKVLETRLAFYDLPPLPKIHHVDTKLVLKAKLSLYSNSLADAAKFFKLSDKMGIPGKWGLWERIAFKEETAADLRLMTEYCKQDVVVLEQLHDKLQSRIGSSAINRTHWAPVGTKVCPSCGSDKIHGHGERRNTTAVYKRYFCNGCGSTFRTDKQDKRGVFE